MCIESSDETRVLFLLFLQPIARFQGQATDVELARKEVTNVKAELVIFWIPCLSFLLQFESQKWIQFI